MSDSAEIPAFPEALLPALQEALGLLAPAGLQQEIRELERSADRGEEEAVRERPLRLVARPASDAVEYAGR